MEITPGMFEAYLKCPTKCWLRASGEASEENPYAQWVKTQTDSYREAETTRMAADFPDSEVDRSRSAENAKSATWRLATGMAMQAEMGACVLESELHAVERVPAGGRGKAAQFIPIRFIFTNKLGKDHKLLLAFDALALGKMLGRQISLGKIVHGDDHATLKVKTAALVGEVRKRVEKITALLSNPEPPDLVLNRHCTECEYQARCRKIAVEKDDLSLLANMSAKERQKLHNKGIFTVTQLSYTFRPRRRPKRMREKREKYHHSLKALAIREKKIHIVGSPELKIEGTPVYLDVEGRPDRDFYYLIGLRLGNGESAVQHSLWADTVADEGKIWRKFLAILETVEKPVLVHYGSYETSFLERMKERHTLALESPTKTKAISVVVNIVSVMFSKIYFPTFTNGLKEIARNLNFEWSNVEASGLTSIIWRHQWEGTRSEELRQKLIKYNANDCAALARLEERLGELMFDSEGQKAKPSADVVHTDSLPRDFPSIFKSNRFQIAEFEQINKAAYWDYQRERVLVRSSQNPKVITRKATQIGRKRTRVNAVVNWPMPKTCPQCGGFKIYRHQTAQKTVIDLRFGPACLKKWVTNYRFNYCRCPTCRTVFLDSKHAWSREKFGPNLKTFCIYQNIELRLPQHQIATFLNLVLGFQLTCTAVNKFKESAAAFYQGTYDALLKSITSGSLVHADETTVNLHQQTGYVWVFANLEEVVYMFYPSREGDLVQRVLKDFEGVLVSDFYAAYDSLNCTQQKCLIHLIRDLDVDLFNEPFNAEYKKLVSEFAALLKPMIETVDRFGLKTRFLRRHKDDVHRFFKRLSRWECQSETGRKCKQRLEKNRDTLFTFLDHDGVPWNNNNAEHAVKAFALLRRDIDGLSTEKGIKEYLVLLSICQTCKCLGVEFLDFLRSGENNIRAFAENRSRKRGDTIVKRAS